MDPNILLFNRWRTIIKSKAMLFSFHFFIYFLLGSFTDKLLNNVTSWSVLIHPYIMIRSQTIYRFPMKRKEDTHMLTRPSELNMLRSVWDNLDFCVTQIMFYLEIHESEYNVILLPVAGIIHLLFHWNLLTK